MELNICHLYPDILNLYGDRGNIITMKRRMEDRGIKVNVEAARSEKLWMQTAMISSSLAEVRILNRKSF